MLQIGPIEKLYNVFTRVIDLSDIFASLWSGDPIGHICPPLVGRHPIGHFIGHICLPLVGRPYRTYLPPFGRETLSDIFASLWSGDILSDIFASLGKRVHHKNNENS